jgi:hypothetical protein
MPELEPVICMSSKRAGCATRTGTATSRNRLPSVVAFVVALRRTNALPAASLAVAAVSVLTVTT